MRFYIIVVTYSTPRLWCLRLKQYTFQFGLPEHGDEACGSWTARTTRETYGLIPREFNANSRRKVVYSVLEVAQ